MTARDDLMMELTYERCDDDQADQLIRDYRAEVTAEFVAWLVKKAREHRAPGPQYAKQADAIGRAAMAKPYDPQWASAFLAGYQAATASTTHGHH